MAKCDGERFIKIGPYLPKLSHKYCVGVFLTHSVNLHGFADYSSQVKSVLIIGSRLGNPRRFAVNELETGGEKVGHVNIVICHVVWTSLVLSIPKSRE